MKTAIVIGAGPAGLMAAQALVDAGLRVTIADAMPSVGRKFLMAGKSGLNITKDVDQATFQSSYQPCPASLKAALSAFGPEAVKSWARDLGQEIFTGTTGRVFPKVMKASPLLRAMLARLGAQSVTILTRHRWMGWDADAHRFQTPEGMVTFTADVTVLALGGASWSRLGSDGEWAKHFPDITPFAPSNAGVTIDWSPFMAKHFGKPMKAVTLQAGPITSRGEWIISQHGMEGGGVYNLTPALREGHALTIDLLPDWSEAKIRTALERPRGKASFSNHLRKVLRLDPARLALLYECLNPLPKDLAAAIKQIKLPVTGLRPIDEAISTVGGVAWSSLDDSLMLTQRPGVFCAGEMLDWDAPTGGFLINGCLATGLFAGREAAEFAQKDLCEDG